MNVYLIRHGMTKGNQEHRYVGRTNEPILKEELEALKQMGRNLPEMNRIFVSPYLRCIQTAEAIFGMAEQELEQIEDFRELDFGDFEYKNYQELNGNEDYQHFIDSGGTIAFPGGEEPPEFKERCKKAFLDCMEKVEQNNWENIAFAVHGGTIMAILEALGYPKKDYFDYQIGNGEGYKALWLPEKEHLEVQTKFPPAISHSAVSLYLGSGTCL